MRSSVIFRFARQGWLGLTLLALLAAACAPRPTPSPTATPPPTATTPPTATPVPPTATPTVTPSPTPTPIPPTATPTFTPSPTATATPGTPIFRQGKIDFVFDKTINLDNGSKDIAYHRSDSQVDELRHVGLHVAFYGPLYFWPPDIADCYNAPYDPANNALLNLSRYVGLSFCYYTNEGRVGALHIDADYIDGTGQRHLVITFITWAAFLKKK